MMKGLEVKDRGAYLSFEFSSEFTVSAGKECVDWMVAACAEKQCSRALLDCRQMTGKMSVFDRFDVVNYAQKTRGIIHRIAILLREDQTLPDKFAENVGVNRGIGLRVFTDDDQAISWLEE
ncbi:MAG TPA: hypothetical protein DDX85_02140 [Nitrospiraceae bacterium]|nr:hypothetical protein [Nitrospiraceae bacterium]